MKVDNNQNKRRALKAELYRDNFQNSKVYNIPRAQLIIADMKYFLYLCNMKKYNRNLQNNKSNW